MDGSGNTIFNLFVIAFLLFSNGFFVASEFAMVKVRKTRIEQLVNEGNYNAQIAMEALKDLDKFIAAVQLGVTISSIGLGWVGEGTLAHIIEPIFAFLPGISQNIATHTMSVSIAFALITFFHVVLGELIPKSIALEYTEKTALWVARPMQVLTFIFNPFIWLLNGFGNFVLKLLNIPHSHKGSLVHSTEELDMLVNASYNGGVLNETEKEMLHNVFKFSDLTAKQIKEINKIKKIGGLELLDEKTKEVAIYRLKYPDVSLVELSEIISIETGKQISKSGIYHRFNKIKEMAKKIKED